MSILKTADEKDTVEHSLTKTMHTISMDCSYNRRNTKFQSFTELLSSAGGWWQQGPPARCWPPGQSGWRPFPTWGTSRPAASHPLPSPSGVKLEIKCNEHCIRALQGINHADPPPPKTALLKNLYYIVELISEKHAHHLRMVSYIARRLKTRFSLHTWTK